MGGMSSAFYPSHKFGAFPMHLRIVLTLLLMTGFWGFSHPASAHEFDGLLVEASFQPKVQKVFPTITGTKRIALTIDDGPTKEVTTAMLALLKSLNIKATFFMLGMQAEKNPQLAQAVADAGHVIGNHTYDHKFFLYKKEKTDKEYTCRTDEMAHAEIRATHDILKPFIKSQQKHFYFRPPGGGWCSRYASLMNGDPELKQYVGPLYWNMGGGMWYERDGDPTSPIRDAGDEECWTTGIKPEICLAGYRASVARLKGGVMLVHDVHMKTVEMLKILLPELIKQGYKFVTLDEVASLDGSQEI
jgi:peptidoglycan/xylan/chitin deacetylase (PgdA/CDA1 family)